MRSSDADWVTLLSPSGTGTIVFRDAARGSLAENSSQSNLTTLPSTWSAGANWANSPISAYASVTATGPALSVTPAAVNLTATAGGSGPPPADLSVTPSHGAPVNIAVTLTVTAAGLHTLIGDGNIEPNADDNTAGSAEAFPATATATGSMVQVRVYIDQGSAASKLVAGLYTSVSGPPAQLLTQGTLSNPVAGGWNTLTVPAASVTSGTGYWIAILSPAGSGTLNFRDRNGGATTETSQSTTLTTLPTTWTTGRTWSNSNLSATGLG